MTTTDIQNRIDEILTDSRFLSKTATIIENAPLAFIQFGLLTELHTLQKVLSLPLSDIKQLRNE